MLKYLVKKNIESFLNSRFQNNGKNATVNDDTFFIFTTDPQKYSQINKVEKIYRFNNKNCPFFMKRLVKNLDGYINLRYMFHNIVSHMFYPKSDSIQNDSTTYYLMVLQGNNQNIHHVKKCINVLILCADDASFRRKKSKDIIKSYLLKENNDVEHINMFYTGLSLSKNTNYNEYVHLDNHKTVEIHHIVLPRKFRNLNFISKNKYDEINFDIVINEYCPFFVLLDYLDEIMDNQMKPNGILINPYGWDHMKIFSYYYSRIITKNFYKNWKEIYAFNTENVGWTTYKKKKKVIYYGMCIKKNLIMVIL